MTRVLHVISHTDLDGVAAAATAWLAYSPERPVRLSLAGYGSVDALILESLETSVPFVVLDLFCQDARTVDAVDRAWKDGEMPAAFDHHETTGSRYGGRPWIVFDSSVCGAKVFHRWLMEHGTREQTDRIKGLADFVDIANDRDLWINERPEGRLWQALITLCGPWSVMTRVVSGEPVLRESERVTAEDFVVRQEARFQKALERVNRSNRELAFVEPGILEYGDVSDFGGLILDRMEKPPFLVAVAAKRAGGEWAVSLRSRSETAGKVVALLKDGRKVRGGGHDDSAALYFPSSYTPDQIRETLSAAMRTIQDRERPTGVTLGDMLGNALRREGA